MADLDVETHTTVEFIEGATGIFEAARGTWREAERDLFSEVRDGITPIEPLIGRLAEGREPPFAAFVIRPAEEPFVLVALAIEQDEVLAGTIRESYGEGGSVTHGL